MANFRITSLCLALLLALSGAVYAQDESARNEDTVAEPVTATAKMAPDDSTFTDTSISNEDLTDRLRAFTAERLKTEAEGWQGKLSEKVSQIAGTNIELRATEDEEQKAALRELLSELSAEKAAIQQRFDLVLSALAEKGGDPEPFQAYLDAVSGAQIDTTDVATTTHLVTDWLKSKDGGILWAKNIVIAIVVLIVFMYLGRLVGGILRAAISRSKLSVSEGLNRFFVGIARKLTLLFGVVVALSVIGIDIGPFIAALGVGGFIIGFALQDTLGNFAAGIMILMYKPFEIGHFVDAGGVKGTIEDISLVSTTFKTPDNQRHIVPNGSVWGGVITNVTGQSRRRVDMVFGIGYGDDIAKAEKVLQGIVKDHPKTLDDPEPMIKVNELGDSSVNFVCRPWTNTADYWDVYFDITRSVKERFDEEGISIPFPQRDVHLYKED